MLMQQTNSVRLPNQMLKPIPLINKNISSILRKWTYPTRICSSISEVQLTSTYKTSLCFSKNELVYGSHSFLKMFDTFREVCIQKMDPWKRKLSKIFPSQSIQIFFIYWSYFFISQTDTLLPPNITHLSICCCFF